MSETKFLRINTYLRQTFHFDTLGQKSLLTNLASQHHKLYQELFHLNLKPRHHNLLHYTLIIRTVGPLYQMKTLSFELSMLYANVVS
ncbi:hypothetical protein RI129_008222 [Pyrocoelia pectoralis]|uniref:Uncharacterized protein n=1 Tax=Pyrocoelia pectoralis TaxID=417401 RepID=A0AAN7V4X9_9COLE